MLLDAVGGDTTHLPMCLAYLPGLYGSVTAGCVPPAAWSHSLWPLSSITAAHKDTALENMGLSSSFL